jgi:hypothetical protein
VIDGATVLFCAAGRENQVFVDLENAVMCPENSADRLAFTKCQCLRKNAQKRRTFIQFEWKFVATLPRQSYAGVECK